MDITSANAKCFLTIEELFPAGVLLQNYATDQAVDQDERQISIVRMGVDRILYTLPLKQIARL